MLNWWLPENVSTYGADIDWLFHLIYWITGITAILVFVTMAVFLVKYRDRPGSRARYTHGSTPLEIAWTVVPALILVVLTFLSVPAWSRIKMSTPESDFVVRVTGKQFNWEVTYPGPDGKFDTADDKSFDNELHAPANKPVILKLRSRDVIHSFFVPSFRIKQDAVPGREITAWFEAMKPGKYENPCAELCGFGHSGMKGWVFVHTAEDYQKWAGTNLTARAPVPATTVAMRATGPGDKDTPTTEEKAKQ